MKNKQLIISYYSNNLDWVKNVNEDVDVIIYDKSQNNSSHIKLPNIGREPHTYLHHIIENYNNLPEWLILSQDGPNEHVNNWISMVNGNTKDWEENSVFKKDGAYFFSNYQRKVKCDENGSPDHSGLPMIKIWEEIFEEPFPGIIYFIPSCHLIVNKNKILQKSIDFYKKIKSILETEELSPWVIERYMHLIF